jgi:XTP/dITP diphosphohydrolase
VLSASPIVLASSNAGKLAEFQQLFAGHANIIAQSEFNIPNADETGQTFVENALLKARNAAAIANMPTIADDSGIVVNALEGRPGIYSARYAGEQATATANVDKLLHDLTGVPPGERQAHFHCTLVYLRHATDPEPIIASANWYGEILDARQGEAGFGYDPIFYVESENCPAAELDKTRKNVLSHRGQALQKLFGLLMSQNV